MNRLFILVAAGWSITVLTGCSMTSGYRGEKMCQGTSVCPGPSPTLTMSDGAKIPYASWFPPGNRCSGIVIAIPGFDEAACEMHHLGEALSRKGWAVYSCDLRGQGKDREESRLGNFADWPRWVKDVHEISAFARVKYPRAPIYYAGQSTGGIIALAAAEEVGPSVAPRGLILQSPGVLFVLPSAKTRPLLAAVQAVTFNQVRFTAPAMIARDEQGTKIMVDDADEAQWERSPDRVCKGFTIREVRECFAMGAAVADRASRISQPLLVQFGTEDPLFKLTKDPANSPKEFVRMIGSADKRTQWIPGGRHDLLNDRTTRNQLLSFTEKWLDAHR